MFSFRDKDEEAKTLEEMEKYGGSFVRSLVVCYMTADPINKNRLLDAFGDYFKHYALGHKEELGEGKPAVEIYLSMTDIENEKHGHHIAINVKGTKAGAEHLLFHLISDGKNEIGSLLRSVMERGIPLTEEEARKILGDDVVDLADLKRDAQKKTAEKLPN